MGDYSDAWREFRAIMATTEKKLLKKPNLPQAIQQLGSLSLRIQDEDLPQHAAICHVEMAGFYKRLEQPNEERKQYLVAAKLYMKAWREWRKGGSRVNCHYSQEVGHYYSKAVKISMDLRHFQTAGITSLEAGRKMLECGENVDAEEHLTRALHLLEGDFFSQSNTMNFLIQTFLATRRWEELLYAVDSLWMMVMKTRSKSSLGETILKDCEVMSVLALRKIRATPSGRHKVLLDTYGRLNSKKPVFTPGDSDLAREEFNLFVRFISALDEGDQSTAGRLLEQDLVDFISETAQKVAETIVQEPFLSADRF